MRNIEALLQTQLSDGGDKHAASRRVQLDWQQKKATKHSNGSIFNDLVNKVIRFDETSV